MTKEIILINPPSLFLNIPNAYPPTGLMYLGASLEANGFNVKIIDLCNDKKWEQTVGNLEGDIFGVTCTTPNYNAAKSIIRLLPETAIKIIGGPHPSALPHSTFDEINCHVVVGDGEDIISSVIREGKKPRSIWQGDLVDVNKYPIPARHLINVDFYHPEMDGDRSTTIYTSRGCPYNCNFCSKLTGRSIRYRYIDNIITEIKQCKEQYGIRNFVFGDDNFLFSKKRTMQLCDELVKLDINFKCIGRGDHIDKRYLQYLYDHGCTEINYGVESGSQKILDLMGKDETVEDNRDAILWAKEVGLTVKAFFIVGFPGEDESSINETEEFILDTMPDKWLLSQFAPLPSCDVWKHPGKYGVTWMSHNWDDYVLAGQGGITFETDDLKRYDLFEMHDDLYSYLVDILGEMKR